MSSPLDSAPYKTVLLLGPPGVGKGTQGQIFRHIPGFHHCACGDVFRSINISSELGKIFYDYSSRGELVPDHITIRLWAENIHARVILNDFKPDVDLLILDGIPRNVQQAKMLENYLEVVKVCHMVCPDEDEMIHRLRRRALKENRIDDASEDVIRNRWHVYQEQTAPVLAYYPDDLIVPIDALKSPSEVLEQILQTVIPIQNAIFYDNPQDGPSV